MRKHSLRVADVAGFNAARDGRHEDENPYPDGSAERLAWEIAFHAEVERRREARQYLARIAREDRAARRAKVARKPQ